MGDHNKLASQYRETLTRDHPNILIVKALYNILTSGILNILICTQCACYIYSKK